MLDVIASIAVITYSKPPFGFEDERNMLASGVERVRLEAMLPQHKQRVLFFLRGFTVCLEQCESFTRKKS